MENKGLIKRKNLNGNRRSLYVYLTESGKELARRVEREFYIIEEQTLNGFSDEEKETLNKFMTRINKNII